jgi:hypothetical protein
VEKGDFSSGKGYSAAAKDCIEFWAIFEYLGWYSQLDLCSLDECMVPKSNLLSFLYPEAL